MPKSAIDWKNDAQQVDTDNLSKPLAALYAKYKAASVSASTIRKEFETSFIQAAREAKLLTAEQTFAFGYRFGKMVVVATGKDAPKSDKATKGIKL